MFEEKKKYNMPLRSRLRLGIVCAVILFISIGCGIYTWNNRNSLNIDTMKSILRDKELCYLCGYNDQSLMSYYRNFDTIGLLSLNEWYIVDFRLKNYDEYGVEQEEIKGISFLYGSTKDISYQLTSIPSENKAEINVRLPENYKVDMKYLRKNLCQNCLDKVSAALKSQGGKEESRREVPICLVDYKTMEVYSLQSAVCSYCIRDYLVEYSLEDNELKIYVSDLLKN